MTTHPDARPSDGIRGAPHPPPGEGPPFAGHPAVFLDKDGTLVVDVPYNVRPEHIRLTDGALDGLRALHAAGYLLVVVSNQSGVARGYFAESALTGVTARLHELLGAAGVPLAGVYYCPHHPAGTVARYAIACGCRKPEAGLILQAARELNVDLARSWFIGDILHDVEAGRRAGCRTILLDNGNETEWELTPSRLPRHRVADLAEAARVILADSETPYPGEAPPPPGSAPHLPPAAVLDAFARLRVLVVGEAMLDSYLVGASTRLCQEAPVPVVTLTERWDRPGGAANTAANLAALGCQVELLSAIGDDPEGQRLRDLLDQHGVAHDSVLGQAGRRTLAKQRVMAGERLLVRFDQGDTAPVAPDVEQHLLDRLRARYPQVDAVVVSDYGYGVLTSRLIRRLGELQAQTPRLLAVDARDLPAYREVGVTAVKPNYQEALRLVRAVAADGGSIADGGPVESASRATIAITIGEAVLARTGARIAAITLDTDGAVVVERGCAVYRTYAEPADQRCAAGAGDTYVGALALALATGAPTPLAAEIAAAAAAVVVSREGTVACTLAELRAATRHLGVAPAIARAPRPARSSRPGTERAAPAPALQIGEGVGR